MNTADF